MAGVAVLVLDRSYRGRSEDPETPDALAGAGTVVAQSSPRERALT